MIAFLYRIPGFYLLLNFISHFFALILMMLTGTTILILDKTGLMNRKLEHFFPRFWCNMMLSLYGVSVKAKGIENYDPNKAYVLVTNHQSQFDIPAVFATYSGHIKMIAKAELFSVPFFGWAATGVKFIKINRGNRRSGIEAQDDLNKKLKEGNQVWIAVEGTRSKTGELLPFKKGAFRIAKTNNVGILPMVIFDAREALPKGDLLVKGGRQINVEVLPEYTPEEFENLHIDEMSKEIKRRMSKSLENFNNQKNSVK